MVFLPHWITDLPISVFLWGFLLLMICSSLTIVVILLTTHMLEDSNFPDPDENGVMPFSWAKHQVLTTSDYATDSLVVTHLLVDLIIMLFIICSSIYVIFIILN